MRALIFAIAALAVCGCAPSKPNIVPLENVSLFDDYTYIVVANPKRVKTLSQYVFCRDDGSNQYTLGILRNVITCEAPDSGLFARADLDVTSVQYEVRDGLTLSFRPIVKRGIPATDPDGSPHFLAAGARQDGLSASAYSGEIGIHRVAEHSLHFVGFEQADNSIRWRDPGNLAAEIATRVKGASPDRVVVQKPEIANVTCSDDKRSPVCTVQRAK